MSDLGVGLFGIGALFALMLFRTPVGFAMLLTGFYGVWFLDGLRRATAIMFTETYSSISNYNLIVVPMFVLLGNIASEAGFSRALYDAAYAWVGRFRGGLASASVMGCAAFSAISGSSVATAVTIGRVALPDMKRFGYASGLATGSIAAGGTLGFLIPPSTGFVVYAILTEESIGRLFMAGILPGILMSALFVVSIWFVTMRNPQAGPPGVAQPLLTRVMLLGRAAPLIGVIVVSIGGIYSGAFTPVEASGVGVVLVALIALVTRRLTWQGFVRAVGETVRTSAMLYMIIVGANVLNPFLAITNVPPALGELLVSVNLGTYGTLSVVLLSYFVLGMFLDGLAMLVLTIPIYFPVIIGLGFDPIWFGVIVVIVIEMGLITPPVGLNVFVVRSVAPDVPLATIFAGVVPFLLAMIVTLILIVLFPAIALFIPNSMFG